MGCNPSKYRVISSTSNINSPIPVPWIANCDTPLTGFKEENFHNITAVGKGKFGYVFLSRYDSSRASERSSGVHVAVKFIAKQFIMETKTVDRIRQEIALLKSVSHPFIVYYFGGFETPACISLVLEYSAGGELYTRMRTVGKMGEECVKFYFCELTSVIRYLHMDKSIVYRDLKPENILLDHNGHIKLCDFGFAVRSSHNKNASSYKLRDTCGTANYIAPEVINGQDTFHSFPVDWWALGCVMFEMALGFAPFGDTGHMTKFAVFENVARKEPNIPRTLSPSFRSLLSGLLNKDQRKRFNWTNIKDCQWVVEVNWDDIYNRRVRPPWKPKCSLRAPDTSNFLSWSDLAVPRGVPTKKVEGYVRELKKLKLLLRDDEERTGTEDDVRSIVSSVMSDGDDDDSDVKSDCTDDLTRRVGNRSRVSSSSNYESNPARPTLKSVANTIIGAKALKGLQQNRAMRQGRGGRHSGKYANTISPKLGPSNLTNNLTISTSSSVDYIGDRNTIKKTPKNKWRHDETVDDLEE